MSGWDASNYIKLIEDALFETYEVNDAYNLLISARKFLSGDDKFHIQIFVCESKLLQGIPNLE
jgi:two-component sensor histidine kinase